MMKTWLKKRIDNVNGFYIFLGEWIKYLWLNLFHNDQFFWRIAYKTVDEKCYGQQWRYGSIALVPRHHWETLRPWVLTRAVIYPKKKENPALTRYKLTWVQSEHMRKTVLFIFKRSRISEIGRLILSLTSEYLPFNHRKEYVQRSRVPIARSTHRPVGTLWEIVMVILRLIEW